MTGFIFIGDGYLNISKIKQAKQTSDGKYMIYTDEGLVDRDNADFEGAIIDLAPISGDWEVLFRIKEDGPDTYVTEPVLAWGRTVLNQVVPITPSELRGVEGDYALRKVGSKSIYSPNSLFTYESPEDWILSLNES